MFKYADIRFTLNHSADVIKDILKSCPFVGGFKNKLVDVKIHELNAGECPCVFGWHLDGNPDPFVYPKPEVYHLFLIGPEQSRTLFLDEPVELDVKTGTPQQLDADYKKQLATLNPKYSHAPEHTWITFTSEDFHSGPIANSNARRLLVRVCETDHIKPRNTIVEESFVQKVA
jgi:hypothetical protein